MSAKEGISYSVSPYGDKFPIPKAADYPKEFSRVEKLARKARSEGKEIVAVDRKVIPVRRLILSPEQARFLHISSIGLLPLLLLVVGGFLWWRRR